VTHDSPHDSGEPRRPDAAVPLPVVLAVDGGPASRGAIDYAAREAERRTGAIRIVHVLPDLVPLYLQGHSLTDHLVAHGRRIVRHAARRVATDAPGIEVETRLRHGSLVAALVQESTAAGLLVLGRESRTGLQRVLNGSVPAAVAARAHCIVVAVPSAWDPGAISGPVVVGIRDPGRSSELLGCAFIEAARRHVPVHLLHAWKLPSEYDDRIEIRTHAAEWERLSRTAMADVAAPLRAAHPDIEAEIHVVHDHPVAALRRASSATSLLIVGRPRHRLLGAHLGSTARGILHSALGPVEVIPDSYVDRDVFGDAEDHTDPA